MSAGAPKAPLTYEGPYDPDRTYLPRQIVTLDGVPYMATALMQGVTPVPPTPTTPPAGGGDGEHNGTGSDTTAVGTGATASGADSTALGDGATATAGGSWGATALGRSSAATGDRTTAVGYSSTADGDRATVVGASAAASGDRSVAVGMFSQVDYVATRGVAVGVSAHSAHLRAIALGYAATTTASDQAMVKANSLELSQSSGATTGTTVVVLDTVTGDRQRISVAAGVLTVTAA